MENIETESGAYFLIVSLLTCAISQYAGISIVGGKIVRFDHDFQH